MTKAQAPKGKLTLQTVAMPKDTNANGDIFGGWLVSNMDMAAGIAGKRTAKSRVATVAIDDMTFIKPVNVGDTVGCYVDLLKVGKTSMQFLVQVWSESGKSTTDFKIVAQGTFTFVALDELGRPHPVER